MSEESTMKEPTAKEPATDWERLDALEDEQIDLSESPEISPEMFAKAIMRSGLKERPRKEQVTIRLDGDVLAWFRAQGKGYQPRINSLLRAYMELLPGLSETVFGHDPKEGVAILVSAAGLGAIGGSLLIGNISALPMLLRAYFISFGAAIRNAYRSENTVYLQSSGSDEFSRDWIQQ